MTQHSTALFSRYESHVRSYIRSFPTVFNRAKGSLMWDENGQEYLDFFSGAGTLNYGHNNPVIKNALLNYINNDGIVHGLDMGTHAKAEFINALQNVILEPRGLEYKIQFTGPTGTNAVEAALKLARMTKKRKGIIAFTNGYHGHSLGSLSVTANSYYHNDHFDTPSNSHFMAFEGFLGKETDTLKALEKYLTNASSGVEIPAAIIVEAIQAEGGINVASTQWLQGLERICRKHDILLILDEIQIGNGRTGKFFSFEDAGIKPDMVLLSKSVGGGLPLAMVLFKKELDTWQPGQHTGTFRGNNLAFIAGRAALSLWEDNLITPQVEAKSKIIKEELEKLATKYPELDADIRGRGMIYGFDIPKAGLAATISRTAFEHGLIIELCGPTNSTIKILPALTIEEDQLRKGLAIIDQSIQECLDAAE